MLEFGEPTEEINADVLASSTVSPFAPPGTEEEEDIDVLNDSYMSYPQSHPKQQHKKAAKRNTAKFDDGYSSESESKSEDSFIDDDSEKEHSSDSDYKEDD